MEQQDPLAQLNDILLPTSIHNWPITLGWWLLVLLFIVLIIGLFFTWKYYQKQQQVTRLAIEKWQALETSCHTNQAHEYLIAVNQLLKQTAINKGYTNCAHLTGDEWLNFLSSTGHIDFNNPAGKLLAEGIYQTHIETQYLNSLHQLIGQWITTIKNKSKEPLKHGEAKA